MFVKNEHRGVSAGGTKIENLRSLLVDPEVEVTVFQSLFFMPKESITEKSLKIGCVVLKI